MNATDFECQVMPEILGNWPFLKSRMTVQEKASWWRVLGRVTPKRAIDAIHHWKDHQEGTATPGGIGGILFEPSKTGSTGAGAPPGCTLIEHVRYGLNRESSSWDSASDAEMMIEYWSRIVRACENSGSTGLSEYASDQVASLRILAGKT